MIQTTVSYRPQEIWTQRLPDFQLRASLPKGKEDIPHQSLCRETVVDELIGKMA